MRVFEELGAHVDEADPELDGDPIAAWDTLWWSSFAGLLQPHGERVRELARMLAGLEDSASAAAHAQEIGGDSSRIGVSGEALNALMATAVETARSRIDDASGLFHDIVEQVTGNIEQRLGTSTTLIEDQVSRAISTASGRLDDTTRMFQELIGGASEEIERRVDGAAPLLAARATARARCRAYNNSSPR